MSSDVGKKIEVVKVDGGATRSEYIMQFQSSISGVNVIRPKNIESTALGATFLAGLAVGYWKDLKELEKLVKVDKEFKPKLDKEKVEKLVHGWNVAVKRTFNWMKEVDLK